MSYNNDITNKRQYNKKLKTKDVLVKDKFRKLDIYIKKHYDDIIFKQDIKKNAYCDKLDKKLYFIRDSIDSEDDLTEYINNQWIEDSENVLEKLKENDRWETKDLDVLKQEEYPFETKKVTIINKKRYNYKTKRYDGKIKNKIIISIPIIKKQKDNNCRISKNKGLLNTNTKDFNVQKALFASKSIEGLKKPAGFHHL